MLNTLQGIFAWRSETFFALTLGELPGVVVVVDDVLEARGGVHHSLDAQHALQLEDGVGDGAEPAVAKSLQGLEQDPEAVQVEEILQPVLAHLAG